MMGNVILSFMTSAVAPSFLSVILCCILAASPARAQFEHAMWVKTAAGELTERGMRVASNADGSIAVIGMFESDSIRLDNVVLQNFHPHRAILPTPTFFVALYAPDGQLQWAKTGITKYQFTVGDIAVDADGSVLFTCGFEGDSVVFDGQAFQSGSVIKEDAWFHSFVAKCSKGGLLTFGRCIDSVNIYNLSFDDSDNIYIAGVQNGRRADLGAGVSIIRGRDTATQGFIAKYDPNGTALWASDNGTPTGVINDISITSSNEIIACGLISPFALMDNPWVGNGEKSDLTVEKYDQLGRLIWLKHYNLNDELQGFSYVMRTVISETDDIYLVGKHYSKKIAFDTITLTNEGSPYFTNGFVVKLNGRGETQWAKGLKSRHQDWVHTVTLDSHGRLLILADVGTVFTYGSQSFDYSGMHADTSALMMARLDTNGNITWLDVWPVTDSVTVWDLVYDRDDSPICTGSFAAAEVLFGDTIIRNSSDWRTDFFLTKLPSDFASTTGVTMHPEGNSLERARNTPLVLYRHLLLDDRDDIISVRIYDLLGNLVYISYLPESSTSVNLQHLYMGMYTCVTSDRRGNSQGSVFLLD